MQLFFAIGFLTLMLNEIVFSVLIERMIFIMVETTENMHSNENMEVVVPTYWAQISAEVRYDKSLKPMEKLMYGEITALTNLKGYCWATDGRFAELYDVSVETVNRWISKLAKKGYVRITKHRQSNGMVQRRIWIMSSYERMTFKETTVKPAETTDLTKKSIPELDEKINPNLTKKSIPLELDEKVIHNNITNNLTVNKQTTTEKEDVVVVDIERKEAFLKKTYIPNYSKPIKNKAGFIFTLLNKLKEATYADWLTELNLIDNTHTPKDDELTKEQFTEKFKQRSREPLPDFIIDQKWESYLQSGKLPF